MAGVCKEGSRPFYFQPFFFAADSAAIFLFEVSTMRILITGSNGQLGKACKHLLSPLHRVDCVDIQELDIAVASQVNAYLSHLHPEVIINCAAFTRVDACETEKKAAHAVNALGPENLATWAHINGSRLIHVSTDYVFSGDKPVPEAYTESDPPLPMSYYGTSKLAGEKSIQERMENYAILRTAWLYSADGDNFLKTMLRLSLENANRTLRVVNDQFGSPTWAGALAEQIKTVVESKIKGVLHATSEGYCSWFDFAITFLELMKIPHRILPCSTAEYPTPAKRPANSILENKELKLFGIHRMKHWREDLTLFVKTHREDLIRSVQSIKASS